MLLTSQKPPAAGQFAEVSRSLGLALHSHEEPVNETSVQRLLPFRFNRRGPGLAWATSAVRIGTW